MTAAQAYTITELPQPAFGTDVRIHAISHAGHVVGSFVTPTTVGSVRQAHLWRPDGSGGYLPPTNLGALASPRNESEAVDVNDRGEVVGYVATLTLPQRVDGVVWKLANGRYEAQTVSGGRLVAINHDEELVQNMASGVGVLSSWKSSRGASNNPIVLQRAVAHAINDLGDVVGEIRDSSTGATPEAFITTNEKTTSYSLLPQGNGGRALDVNAFRVVCGTSKTAKGAAVWLPTYDVFRRVWTWSHRSLHRMMSSEARGVNDLGEVIGVWRDVAGTLRGFLHDSKDGVVLGFDELVQGGELDAIEPVDINNAGEIVGTAQRAGHLVPFIMRPQRSYALVELPFEPAAINNRGKVVGGLESLGNPQGAFVYENGQTSAVGGQSDWAWDVNEEGRYVGDFAGGPTNAAARVYNSWVWLSEPPGHAPSYGRGIANGHWASGYSGTNQGLVWSTLFARGGATVPPTHNIAGGFGRVSPDGFQALRINASRQIAGAAIEDTGAGRFRLYPAVWSRRYGPELAGISGERGFLEAINDAGVAVGNESVAMSPMSNVLRLRAIVFDRGAGGTGKLDELASDTISFTQARGINARGEIVGSSNGYACRWTGATVGNLNDQLSAADGAVWTLTMAIDVNDRGQVVGLGRRQGSSGLRGFLLTLP